MKDWSQVRQRSRYGSNSSQLPKYHVPSKNKRLIEITQPITFYHLVGIFSYIICIMFAVVVIERILPPDLKRSDEIKHPERFIAQRAMEHLVELTSFGPRVSGSHENEVLAVNFLKNEITKIINESRSIHVMEMDVQKASGSFPLKFLDGMTSVYRNVQNVIVKIGSRMTSEYSLLINCHFDSVSDSPGASDDGAGCAVMLEILRVLSKSNKVLKNNVIFLFNGAEENVLQASHGFITQHMWAKEVRAFINLEACGAGGREVLFQAGPHSPWIMEVYSQTVPYPYASSLAQEIFESGFIPGETDFRIFRDFGNISGLDFAWSTNGYVYHTKFDSVSQIPLGTLQRTGDNMLALVLGISNGYYLSLPLSTEGQPIFFDILGAFVVRLPITLGCIVGLGALIIALVNIYLNIQSAKKRGVDGQLYVSGIITACLVLLLSWMATVTTCVGVASMLTAIGRAMSWFARPLWMYALYVSQVVCVPIVCLLAASTKQRKNQRLSGWFLIQLYTDAFVVLWGLVLLLCMFMRIRSGYVALLWVLCPSAAGLLRHAFSSHINDWKKLLIYLLGTALPFIQSYYQVIGALYMAIPIMGRAGSDLLPELVVSVLVSLMFLLVLGWVGPLVIGAESPWKLVNWLLGVILVSVGIVILTPLGFPYSGDIHKPAPQRFMLVHTDRQFYGLNGESLGTSSGYWFVDLDTNSPHSVDGYVPSMRSAMEVNDAQCSTILYCGVPYLLPVQNLIKNTHWLETAPPSIPYRAHINMTNREKVNATLERFHFKITGPDHIGIMLSPVVGAQVSSWSLVAGQKPLGNPLWNGNRESYFIYLAASSEHEIPWHFHIDITHDFQNEPLYWLDMNIVGHFLHGPHKADSHLKSFVNKFPSWTAVTTWSASLTTYMF